MRRKQAGRLSFRRKTSRFWDIWPLPPLIETACDVVYVDGIYLGRKVCILICCNDEHVLGWYLCRYEHARAWNTLFSRIAQPSVVVSDGGAGFAKALRKSWPDTQHQRCVFHVFSQVKRYTTTKPKTAAGIELYMLSKELFNIKSKAEADRWTQLFVDWMRRHNKFLSQMTYD